MKTFTKNIIKEWDRALPAHHEAGMSWYVDAHNEAKTMGDLVIASGVIAAMSPNTPWDRNLVIARNAMATGVATGTLGNSCIKANRIMAGEDPLSVLGGLKVRSFYKNIVDPTCSEAVTIDRHAYDIAVDTRNGKDRRPIGTPKQYEAIANAYRVVADSLGIMPWQLQAVTWESWRSRLTARRSIAA